MRKVCIVCVMIVAATVLGATTGCTTMAGWVGVASERYVDERVTEMEAQMHGNREAIADVRHQLDVFEETASKIEDALLSVEEAVSTTSELRQLADVLEDRLNDLPQETIRQLIGILENHLESLR